MEVPYAYASKNQSIYSKDYDNFDVALREAFVVLPCTSEMMVCLEDLFEDNS